MKAILAGFILLVAQAIVVPRLPSAAAHAEQRAFSKPGGAIVHVLSGEIDDQVMNVITVEGELKPGDDRSFKQAVLTVNGPTLISLKSGGGSLHVGLEIGRTIWLNQFMTVVEDNVCASACALAWLAGRPRFAAAGAQIGFHSPTRRDDVSRQASSVGSAIVNAYLAALGLTTAAIAYLGEASPDDMNWLTSDQARILGIYYKEFGAR